MLEQHWMKAGIETVGMIRRHREGGECRKVITCIYSLHLRHKFTVSLFYFTKTAATFAAFPCDPCLPSHLLKSHPFALLSLAYQLKHRVGLPWSVLRIRDRSSSRSDRRETTFFLAPSSSATSHANITSMSYIKLAMSDTKQRTNL